MDADPQVRGYAVTVEVFVPAETAGQMLDRLDRAWHIENWTPAAAASRVVHDALHGAGLKEIENVGTRPVIR